MALDNRLGCFCPHGDIHIEGTQGGPLSGLTFAAKDLFDIEGHVTGAGNPDWLATHAPAPATASAVRKLLEAGASLQGKTITDELAYSLAGVNMHYGTPVNPACPDRLPGGSSSGSASAVAGGLVDTALGTDTGGSIRVPANNCGLYGIRTTHGQVAKDGLVPLADSFDTVGWFARDARTLARVGEVLLGPRESFPAGRLVIATDCFDLVGADVRAALKPLVDRLIAPSAFLRDRFIAWGIPAERIVHQPNALPEGWAGRSPLPPRDRRPGEPAIFGFFANVMPHKGLHVLLEAALSLKAQGVDGFRVAVHGSDKHAPEAYKARIAALVENLGASISLRGGYAHEELPELLAGVDAVIVPSVWWENDPLIVRQAAAAGRPILHADLGGLAEAGNQSDGMAFAPGDAAALAQRLLAFVRGTEAFIPQISEPALAAIDGQRQLPEKRPA